MGAREARGGRDLRLRYGIIGTGMMGCEHIRNLDLIEGATVTAIADPDERSRAFGRLACRQARGASTEDGVDVYDDYRDLLARAPVDVVVIASPNHTHAAVLDDVFREGARRGLHVLVEKPLCTTVEDCQRVVEAADAYPGVLWVGMEYRYMRPVERLLEEVRDGAVGRLRMLAIREHRFPFLPKVGDWNRFARYTGGTLVEKCCHFFDLMNLILEARPLRVYASGAMDVNHLDERYAGERPDILDNAYCVVDYEGGARALLDLCMFAENSVNEMELAVTGDRGKIEAFIPEHRMVITRRDRREPATIRFDVDARASAAGAHHGSTFRAHLALRGAIARGEAPAVSARDGLLAVAVGAAAELSAREQRAVELTELGL